MNVNSILNSSIKVLMITTLVIALCISAIFIFPPSYGLDFSSYFSNEKNNGDTGTSSVSISGNVVTINANKTSYGYNTSIDFCIGYTCSFTCNFELSDNSNLSYTLVNAVSGVDVQFTDLVNCTSNGSSITPTDYSGSFTMVCSNTGGVRFRSTAATANTDYTATFTLSSVVIDDTPFGDTASFERTITIRPGYVAYVETDGGTLDLTANFHEFSRFSRPLWDNGVRISFVGGLVPTSGTTFNNSFGSSIDWLKPASAPSNLLGQTMVGGKSYTAGLPEGGSNKCVVIYNPAYANADTIIGGGTPTIGPTITAHFSNLVSVNQYALQGDVTRTFQDGITVDSGSPNGYNEGYLYIPSENDPTSVVSDSDYYQYDLADNTSSPAITITAGGYNATADYGNTTAPEEAEKGIIGLLSRILQFLSSPITHIMNLFTAGGNFMAWLGQLWVWLPSDVGAILVDALIVLIVIGAIKFLWK